MEKLRAQMKEIEASRVDGKFVGPDGQPANGSDEVSELLHRCQRWFEVVLERYILSLSMT